MEEKLGITNIEAVLEFCLDLGLLIAKDLEDGKMSTGEIVTLVTRVPKALNTAKKIKEAIAEAKDLDSEEVGKIITTVIAKLDLKL